MDTTKIRIKEHFGIVTNETSTKQIRFMISPPKNRQSIQQQDIVLLDHPIYGDTCQVFAQVKQIASYEEVAGSTLNERLGKMLAIADIIGYANQQNDDKPIQQLLTPPNPGSRIYMPYVSFIEDAYARDRIGKKFEQPLHVGTMGTSAITLEGQNRQVNLFLNAQDLSGMHTLVAAVNGAGKTNAVKVIIGEFTQKSNQPIVIIDPNGEYCNLTAQDYTLTAVSPQAETLETPKIKPNQITILNGQTLSYAEKSEFFSSQIEALAKARLEKTVPSFLLIIEEPENINAEALVEVIVPKIGVSTVLVTSNPTALEAAVLSQMGNQILGKTVNPTDTAHLKAMINCTEQDLNSLSQGEFFVNSLNMARPLKVQIKLAQQ